MTFYPAAVNHINLVGQIGGFAQVGLDGKIKAGKIEPVVLNPDAYGNVRIQAPTFPEVRIDDDSMIPNSADNLDPQHEKIVDGLGRSPTSLPPGTWTVWNIDLVGLLKHDHPVVYNSNGLLSMNDLKNVSRRELDRFEVAGLEELRNGEDLYARKQKGQQGMIRMLGAVRAQKHCLACHEAKEGTLLGAFSYKLLNYR